LTRREAALGWLVIYAKGVCMGTADAVPGVSGGTIALITGVYERLIGAITAVSPGRLRDLLSAVVPGEDHDTAWRAVAEMDLVFLVVLGTGVVTAVVTVTRLVDTALETIPVLTFGFFFGLIGASAVVLWSDVHLDTRGRIAAAVTGFVVAFVVSGQAAATFGHRPVVTFFAGMIAVSALVLPGISGSLILILIGQYEFMIGTLREAVDGLLAAALGGTVPGLGPSLVTVVTFVTGAFVGLFTTSHVVRWALSRRREATLAFLVSLIVGALRAPVADVGRRLAEANRSWTPELVGAFLAAAVVGGAVVLLVERSTSLGLDAEESETT
jgi:putative membrane protein